MAKVYGVMLLVLLAGCKCPPATVDTSAFLASLDSAQAANEIYAESILAKQDESLNALADIKTEVKTLKASLVKSEPQREEVIKSADEPQEAKRPNQSQPLLPVGTPPAVRLFVSNADFPCPPCEALKRAVDAGEFAGFEVEYVSDWRPRSYPAIRFRTPTTSTGWGVVYGYDNSTVKTLRKLTSVPVGGAPTGAFFPRYSAYPVASSGTAFRSVSRWIGYGGRSRVKTRISCGPGGCP